MKEHPILFSTEMIRAIQSGNKTMTRRVKVKNYQIGDMLWGRAAFAIDECREDQSQPKYLYKADYSDHPGTKNDIGVSKWKPSIFMPREASRITLEITCLRQERLQDISDSDIRLEGIFLHYIARGTAYYGTQETELRNLKTSQREAFKELWWSINGKESWVLNPIVNVVEFRKI